MKTYNYEEFREKLMKIYFKELPCRNVQDIKELVLDELEMWFFPKERELRNLKEAIEEMGRLEEEYKKLKEDYDQELQELEGK